MSGVSKYPEGTKILCNDVKGVVIPNFMMPGDICIKWEDGGACSYDVGWLDENATIIKES